MRVGRRQFRGLCRWFGGLGFGRFGDLFGLVRSLKDGWGGGAKETRRRGGSNCRDGRRRSSPLGAHDSLIGGRHGGRESSGRFFKFG